jgi:LPS sulfotransferase NodH
VVAPLLSALPFRLPASGKGAPTKLFYRVIYMEREIEEILASQEQFLRRLGKEPRSNAYRGDLAKAYLQQVRDAKQWCQNQRVNPISIDYRALIEKPEETIASLSDFLGITGKGTEMLACVDPKLYRSRKET